MASPINHYIIRAVGSNVIAIENMIDKETEAYEGHLECSKLWRWIRTASCPPPRPSEISHGWGTLLHVLVVGGLLIKFITEKEIRCLAHGSYYDPHSKQWSRLTSLYQPVHRRRRIIPITPFQYHNKLFFSGQLFGYFQYVCSYYNFETHTWSPWNATPELILLANAVGKFGRKRWVQEDEDDRVLFVEAADGTLFVVERNFCYHNSAYFLSIDESAAEGFEWIELDLAPMHGYTFEKKKYFNTQAWPLQGNGGIVIVSEPILQQGEVEWCFLNKSGVYATGTVHRCNVRGFNRAQYMQYMHDVYWIDPFEEDSVHSFNRTDYALIYTHI